MDSQTFQFFQRVFKTRLSAFFCSKHWVNDFYISASRRVERWIVNVAGNEKKQNNCLQFCLHHDNNNELQSVTSYDRGQGL